MRVLLVEDDAQLGKALELGMKQGGCTVDWARDGENALNALDVGQYSAVALDLNLPDMTGWQVLRKLRQRSSLPVIIMTARDGVDDRIEGLDLGADDYLVKPFYIKELLARLRAIVRRSQGRSTAALVHGEVELDTSTRTVKKAGVPVRLTGKEYKILVLLMERIGRILTRSEIEEHIYRADDTFESNTIEAAIYTLRKKLGRDFISNIRGVGYSIHL